MPPRAKKAVTPEVDPFEDTPDQDNGPGGDEAQAEFNPPWELGNETDVNLTDTKEEKVIIVGSGEGKVVGTIKGGRDYDEPWIVFHCDDLQELVDNLTNRELLGQAMDAAQQASKKFRDLRPTEDRGTTGSASQNGSQARSQGRPAAATQGPWGEQRCTHGVMAFKSGMGDDNQVWQGYFCPAPKGAPDKCKNKYVK